MRFPRLAVFFLLLCPCAMAARGQSYVRVKQNQFDTIATVDTVLNYIAHPGLNAFDIECTSNPFGPCKYSAGAWGFWPLGTVQFDSQVFLQGYGSAIGLTEGLGMGAMHHAFSTSPPYNNFDYTSYNLWLLPPKYHVNGYFSEDTLQAPIIVDLKAVVNSVPGTPSDTLNTLYQRFKFVSGGTYFDMDYVFASDEYDTTYPYNSPQFYTSNMAFDNTCGTQSHTYLDHPLSRIMGTFNDGMIILLSGPGISGSYSNGAENIATVPGTNDPVTVRSVRPNFGTGLPADTGMNAQFFHWNTANYFPLDGYTDVLSVKKPLINPCDTYTVELMLAQSGFMCFVQDLQPAGSTVLGASAIIVKKNSARTGFWFPAPLKLYDGPNNDTLTEGCPGMEMRFVRFHNLNQSDSFQIVYGGTATYGQDYDSLPQWIHFAPGQDTSAAFVIAPTEDFSAETVETLVMRLMPGGEWPCPVDTTEIELWISDRPPLDAAIADTFFFNPCDTDSIAIGPAYVNGLAPFSFQWSTGGTGWFETVAPTATQNYTLTIYDACAMDSIVLTAVARVAPAPQFELINNDSTISCADTLLPIGFKIIGNYYPQLHYKWQEGGQTDSIIYVNPVVEGTHFYTLKAYLPCLPDSFPVTLTVNVVNDPVVATAADIHSTTCPGRAHTLAAAVSGGYPPYTYGWNTGENTLEKTASPLATTTYVFTVTDVCALDTTVLPATIHIPPYDSLRILGPVGFEMPCPTGFVNLHGGEYIGKGGHGNAGQGRYSFSWDNWKTFGKTIQFLADRDTALLLQMTDTCHVDTAILPVPVTVFKGPFVAVDFSDTLHACLGDTFVLAPSVTGGVRPYTYAWAGGQSDSALVLVPTAYKQAFALTVTDACQMRHTDATTLYATRPMADFRAHNASAETSTVSFENLSQRAITYLWVFGDGGTGTDKDPAYRYTELKDWEVQLIATDTFGCDDEVTKNLDIPLNLFIPNAFTPNGDGNNDSWMPVGYGFRSFTATVFDRWGQPIASFTHTSPGWDGSVKDNPAPNGTYAYLIEAVTIKGKKELISGNVELVR